MENQQSPRWPKRMLYWLIDDQHIDILLGDLEELYAHRMEERGGLRAKLHYIKDAFDVIRPFAIRKFSFNPLNQYIMYSNYFKVSLRNMKKSRSYAAINFLGLSVGIASFLLIFLYVQHELSYDRYHEHADEIYRIVVENYNPGGEVSRVFQYASPKHGEVIREDYPQVISAVRFNPWNFPIVKYEDKQFEEQFFNFVEPSIFDVFSFDFIEGSPEQALTDPFSVVITESYAQKYFDGQPAMGKILQITDGDVEADFKVTAVVNDFPEESHMSYNFLASWITYENFVPEEQLNDYYGNYNFPTYFRIQSDEFQNLQDQMPAMLDQYIAEIDGAPASEKVGLVFQKLTDIHLDGSAGAGGTNFRYYVRLFSIIGMLILLIACINYMNLSTAKHTRRNKEIGVRKVMGAQNNHVTHQFLVESLCYAVVAMLIGVGITMLTLPFVNDFTGKALSLNPFDNSGLLLSILGVIILIGLLSGAYPALIMARLNAVAAIKNQRIQGGRSWFGTGLVVFQFAITVALILGVFVVDKQIEFIRNKDVGYDRELVVNFWASPTIVEQLDAFKGRLKSNPNIRKVAASSRIPTGRLADALDARIINQNQEQVVDFRLPFIRVDEDYLDLYDIELIAGEPFQVTYYSDTTTTFILNETAVKQLGWTSNEDAVGQKINYGWMSGFITGVVKDFNFESLHSAIQPMILFYSNQFLRRMSVKISGANIPATLSFLENEFKTYNPDRSFNAQFVDDLYNAQYEGERRLSTITKVFSAIAIIVACLGLLGLVAFSMERRSKEISIRKVLGANATNILLMVSKKYLILVLIAFLIAVPTVYYFLMDWLNSFEYRVTIGVGLIVLAGLLAGSIALLTIWSQTLRFALASPNKWLSTE